MYKRLIVMFLFSLMTLAGCSSSSLVGSREVSAAADAAEVRDAWDAVCFNYNFDECPADAILASCTSTMGDLYFGGNFNSDVNGLLGAIQIELDSAILPLPPTNDDLLSSILNDTQWLN